MTELLEQLDGQAVVVVGHSLGALIALDLATKHAEQVSAVVPLNTIYRRTQAVAEAVEAQAAELAQASLPDPSPTVERWFGEEPCGDKAEMVAQCYHWLKTVNPIGYHNVYRVFAREDGPTNSDLSDLACPALFITGSEEPNSTPAMSKAMAELTPKGRALVINNARHMMPMTHADVVNQHLIEFHQQTSGDHGCIRSKGIAPSASKLHDRCHCCWSVRAIISPVLMSLLTPPTSP